MARERVSLYFNTDIPLEKAMWDFINKDGKKSYTIKKIIEQAMNANNMVYVEQVTSKEEYTNDNIIPSDEYEPLHLDEDDPCC